MKYFKLFSEFINENKIPGGISGDMSLEDIAKKHEVDIKELDTEYKKGITIEMEHTDDENIAMEIARDHLFEDPKYYTKLATIENRAHDTINYEISINEKESPVDVRIKELAKDPEIQGKMDGASSAKLEDAFMILFKRGYGAAQTNWGAVNPNIKKLGRVAGANAWGYARLNAFIKKTKGYETTDSDVAKWLKGKGDKPTGDPS